MTKTKLICKSKIAHNSPDHTSPHGTKKDNSTNKLFNYKVYKLFKDVEQLKILDLGCSGGGFVRDCINNGYFAIGLEGSDYSKKSKRAEWATIPDSLFTCDISKKFELFKDNKKISFNLITLWEVFEHIPENKVDNLLKNIKSNLSKDGLFIASICNRSDKPDGVELHLCRKDKRWWMRKFEKHGFYERKELYEYFNKQYIRGRKQTSEDFNVIFGLTKKNNLEIPTQGLKHKLFDDWAGSTIQKRIKNIINGHF